MNRSVRLNCSSQPIHNLKSDRPPLLHRHRIRVHPQKHTLLSRVISPQHPTIRLRLLVTATERERAPPITGNLPIVQQAPRFLFKPAKFEDIEIGEIAIVAIAYVEARRQFGGGVHGIDGGVESARVGVVEVPPIAGMVVAGVGDDSG